jgi:hypothetical protein
MSMTIWTEDWFEPGPNSPAIPLSRWSPYGITPTYAGSGDPFGVGGTYAQWVAKFNSDASNPSQASRLPQNGGGSGSTLDECRWYAHFVLHPPRSGQTRFEVGPYSGTRAWFEYYSGSWKAGVYGTVDLGTGVGPWVVEVAYVADALPALDTSAAVTWRVWLRINGVLVEDGTTLSPSSEHNTAAYGLKTPFFNAASGTSDGFCVSTMYGRYGVTEAIANEMFHRAPAWSATKPSESLLLSYAPGSASFATGSGVTQADIGQGTAKAVLASTAGLDAFRGLRISADFTGHNHGAFPSGDYLFGYLEGKTLPSGGSDTPLPDTGIPTFSGAELPLKSRYTLHLDLYITATTFAPSPDRCVPEITGTATVAVEGGPTTTKAVTYYGAGYPVDTWAGFLATYLAVALGSTTYGHTIQPDVVHLSEWLTVTPPPPPTIYPPTGSYTGSQMFGIVSAPGTYIRFTTDGSAPTVSSEIWTRGLKMRDGMTVKAIALADGDIPSEVASATYSLTGNKIQAIPSYTAHILPYLLEQYKGDNP